MSKIIAITVIMLCITLFSTNFDHVLSGQDLPEVPVAILAVVVEPLQFINDIFSRASGMISLILVVFTIITYRQARQFTRRLEELGLYADLITKSKRGE